MRKTGVLLLVIAATVVSAVLSYKFAAFTYRSQIIVLRGEAALYKAQAEKYAEVIRTIQEAVSSATGTQKDP